MTCILLSPQSHVLPHGLRYGLPVTDHQIYSSKGISAPNSYISMWEPNNTSKSSLDAHPHTHKLVPPSSQLMAAPTIQVLNSDTLASSSAFLFPPPLTAHPLANCLGSVSTIYPESVHFSISYILRSSSVTGTLDQCGCLHPSSSPFHPCCPVCPAHISHERAPVSARVGPRPLSAHSPPAPTSLGVIAPNLSCMTCSSPVPTLASSLSLPAPATQASSLFLQVRAWSCPRTFS